MKTINLITAFAVFTILVTSNVIAAPPSNYSTTDKNEALSAAQAIPYKDVIEKGLTKQFNYVGIPRGEIQIMSGLSSQFESPDMKRKRLPIQYFEAIKAWQEAGLLTYSEIKQSELDLIGSTGTRKYIITPLQSAIDVSDPEESDADWLQIPLGQCTVLSVVKDVEYHNPELSQSDDYRLVVGTYRRSYNKFSKDSGAPAEDTTLKFRALLKVNPFNQSYSYQYADWGEIDSDKWETENISK